ncbi:hypothetical protein DL89DRAFT_266619 [Linderina pennispora]|uniref:Uncharacterized protein n=1 Tax=Linderina pennispora TaxID=61395 RepID=A0A1Y1WDL8_9FUNG|nr:uncharacterized protein DL89DRAFT_266619 [Linderina pennispora]ORX71627.1 hypothetical protein DL89DRAFT_266619 [Linderina pennispora]
MVWCHLVHDRPDLNSRRRVEVVAHWLQDLHAVCVCELVHSLLLVFSATLVSGRAHSPRTKLAKILAAEMD